MQLLLGGLAVLALLLLLAWLYFRSRSKSAGKSGGGFIKPAAYPNPSTAATGAPLDLGRWVSPPTLLVTADHTTFEWKCFRTNQVAGQDDPRPGITVDFVLQGNPEVIFLNSDGQTATVASDRLASGTTAADGTIKLTVMAQSPDVSPGSLWGIERARGLGAEAPFEVRLR